MTLRRPGPLALAAILWIALEFTAFVWVTSRIGLTGAFLVGALTLLAGFAVLRRVGRGALAGLQKAAAGGEPGEGALLDGTLAALGGVLLILPGFLSDLVGLALAAPSIRSAIARRWNGRARGPGGDGVLDLDPQDWREAPGQDDLRRIGRDSAP